MPLQCRDGLAISPVCGPTLALATLGSQHDEMTQAAAPNVYWLYALLHFSLDYRALTHWGTARGKPGVPSTPTKAFESAVIGQFLFYLQFGDALICEVFFVCERLKVEGNKKKKTDKSSVPYTGFFKHLALPRIGQQRNL